VNAETLGLLVIACLAVNLSPGPSVLLVTSVSAARGFRAGIFAVLGMNAGAFVHVLLAASGVAALLATAPLVFTVIQYLGAAYLIYLGIDLLRNRQATDTTTRSSDYQGGDDA
jgi:threonine/homoserine/homoserine lactone efflux protein